MRTLEREYEKSLKDGMITQSIVLPNRVKVTKSKLKRLDKLLKKIPTLYNKASIRKEDNCWVIDMLIYKHINFHFRFEINHNLDIAISYVVKCEENQISPVSFPKKANGVFMHIINSLEQSKYGSNVKMSQYPIEQVLSWYNTYAYSVLLTAESIIKLEILSGKYSQSMVSAFVSTINANILYPTKHLDVTNPFISNEPNPSIRKKIEKIGGYSINSLINKTKELLLFVNNDVKLLDSIERCTSDYSKKRPSYEVVLKTFQECYIDMGFSNTSFYTVAKLIYELNIPKDKILARCKELRPGWEMTPELFINAVYSLLDLKLVVDELIKDDKIIQNSIPLDLRIDKCESYTYRFYYKDESNYIDFDMIDIYTLGKFRRSPELRTILFNEADNIIWDELVCEWVNKLLVIPHNSKYPLYQINPVKTFYKRGLFNSVLEAFQSFPIQSSKLFNLLGIDLFSMLMQLEPLLQVRYTFPRKEAKLNTEMYNYYKSSPKDILKLSNLAIKQLKQFKVGKKVGHKIRAYLNFDKYLSLGFSKEFLINNIDYIGSACSNTGYDPLLNTLRDYDYGTIDEDLIKWVKSAIEKRPNNKVKVYDMLTTYLDYIKMCKDIDLEPVKIKPYQKIRRMIEVEVDGEIKNEIRIVDELIYQHDQIVKLYNYRVKEKESRDFAKQVAIHSALENVEYEDWIFVLPKVYKDLHNEGRVLHHCVASSYSRMAKGETVILFMRKDKDKSKYTLELRENCGYYFVHQAAGKRNSELPRELRTSITHLFNIVEYATK
jgi:hypothetical protein